MQAILNKLTNPTRSIAAGTWVALVSVLSMCFCATTASAQKNVVVTGPVTLLGDLHFNGDSGGWYTSASPLGGNFAVGPNGDVFFGDGYGTETWHSHGNGTTQTVLAPLGNSNAAAVDSYGNVYIAAAYNPNIFKIPYDAATATYTDITAMPTANCVGGNSDTAACVFAPGVSALMTANAGTGNAGIGALAFDAQGNLFFVSDTLPKTNPNTIFKCNAQCQVETDGLGTYPPVMVFADTVAMGGIAIDPWGNLFFTDGASNGGNSGKVSNLNELALQSGTYASSALVLESYTTTAVYNALSGVAVRSDGTVYFSTANDGVFALPSTKTGGPVVSGIYEVSTQGARALALDGKGNLYIEVYTGLLSHDGVVMVAVNNLFLGATTIGGTATTATATVIDSAAACPATLTLTGTEGGKATTEFTAAAGSTCSAAYGTGNGTFSPALSMSGSVYPVTVTFNPTAVGERTAALVISDSANSASGTTAVAGVGGGALANLDPGVWTAYTSGFTKPYSVSVDAAGDLAVADEGGAVYWIPAGSPAGTAPTSIGSGFATPDATAFDANGNLYISDFTNNNVVEIPNVSGALVPASQSIAVAATVAFGGTALKNPSGLAFGPDGVMYISDLGNSRVVSYNPNTGETAVQLTGLTNPWGIAVDASNNLYVANTGAGHVLVDSLGIVTTLTPAGATAPWGVVVDPSGSLLVSDKATGNIVRIPYDSTATPAGLTDSEAFIVENNPSTAYGIALDATGNLYTTDVTGKAVYAIQRTAASLNFGTVQDNVASNPLTIYVEVTGNMPATLATPAFTAPLNTAFTLASTLNNDKCTSGSSGNPGQSCQLQAVLTPPSSTVGPISSTATLSTNATNLATATIYLAGTASLSSVKPQVITGFNPNPAMVVGQQATLSATGGLSGQPVVFTIDSGSTCAACATTSGTNGTTLTASAAGSITVDANQAAGTAGGQAYGPATVVKVPITISNATATGIPALTMNQITWLGATGGGFTSGANPAGGSFAVNQQGNVFAGNQYGGAVVMINGQTGAVTTFGAISNPGGVTVDSNNNLYVSHDYNSTILKVPYVNGAYVPLTDSTSAPACTGTDTVLCSFANAGDNVKAMAFDASGNFYMVSVPGSTGASKIYECGTGCLPTATVKPGTGTVIYSDANGVSQIAVDPWGNLFFTDAVYLSVSNDEASSSNLYELKYTAGTGFASTPVLLQTFTNASPGNYDDQLDGVAVGANGTVYYATQNEGTFAMPNTKTGGPVPANSYVVSSLGAKGMELDANGNEWVAGYHNGGDTIGMAALGDLTATGAQYEGAATNTAATVIDNASGCGTAKTFAFTSSNPEFSATAGGTCSTVGVSLAPTSVSASSYGATISFTATAVNAQTATLSASDTANGGTGTATVTGIGLETPQTITFTAPTTTTYTYSLAPTPITVAATGGGSNKPITFSIDSSSTATAVLTNGNLVTFSSGGTVIIDANELGGLVGGVFYQAATQAQLTLTINPASQTITFTPPATPVAFANGLTIPLYATTTSGQTVVFSIDSSSTATGTVAGNLVTVTGVGSTGVGNLVLDANVSATTDYAAATQVQQTVVVNQGPQAIIFTAPVSPINYLTGLAVPLVASGGGSGNPVVFTLDASSTGTGTISTTVLTGGISTAWLTVNSQGTFVIDANQALSANFLPAPQVQQSVKILPSLPTQVITFISPLTQVVGTPLTIMATASSGLPVSFSTTTPTVCTLSGANNATATFIAAGICTITAAQGGSTAYAAAPLVSQNVIVNANGTLPNITFDFSLPSLSVQQGSVGLTVLTVNSVNNYAGPVSFACSGLPSGSFCTFNPNPIYVVAGQSATTTLSVATSAPTTAAVHHDSRPIFPAATLAVALCLLGFRKRNRLQLLLLLVIAMSGLGLISGCGSSSSSSVVPAKTTTVTVTATAGNVTQSSTFTLTVQ
jgi:sugar lactone lactonase YvrE